MSKVERPRPIPDISDYPIPLGEDGPVFGEPWEAQVFAMAVHLNESGVFEWSEWAENFGSVIRNNQKTKPGSSYYENWLETLELMLTLKTGKFATELVREQQAWKEAALNAPHGEPIELARTVAADRSRLNEKRL